jgi:hypothetical protein
LFLRYLGQTGRESSDSARTAAAKFRIRVQQLQRSFVVPQNGTPQDDTGVAFLSNLSGALAAAARFDGGDARLAERTFGRIVVLNG